LKIRSNKILCDGVNHGFFGRNGGKSLGVYSSLNCSKFVGDNEFLVRQNLDIAKKNLEADKLITLYQTHSNLCIVVDEYTKPDLNADALVTQTPGIAIGVLTADCAPILLCDPQNRIVGAVHAGWRGAAGGIIKSAIEKMKELGSDPKKITAAVGPCISKKSYETDDDFRLNFKKDDDCFSVINNRLHFDLPKYCCNRLIESEIHENNIEVLGIDTYSDQKNYFSYRFANQNTEGVCGRNISAVCLLKE
jgi:YfiH family protein